MTPPEPSPNPIPAAHFCTPRDLEITQLPPTRALAVGSCFLDVLINSTGQDGTTTDFVLATGIEDFPDAPPRNIDEYDYQIVQIPLRYIMHDDIFTHLAPDDTAAHEAAFKRCCQNLELQLRNKLTWTTQHGILTFVFNFMQPQHAGMGRFFPRYSLANPAFFVHALNQELERLLLTVPHTYLVDLDGLAASFGRRYVQDDTFTASNHNSFYSPHQTTPERIENLGPISDYYETAPGDGFRQAILEELRSMLRTSRQTDSIKLVVTDLDDTLWNGVSGEMADMDADIVEGWPVGVVEALAYARKRGIILAICSKNDEARIRTIWDSLFHRRLKLEDFGAIRINWRPKPENMREILAAMNLLPRNVLFVDDNPAERAAMLAAFPDMRVIGDNPFKTRRILLQAAEMQGVGVTEESARRTQMIRAQMDRESARQTISPEEFARDQQTTVTLATIASPLHKRFARAFELINKTNQFNTTGRRWTMAECRAFFGAGGTLTVFDVEDRFTSYGLVGVVLVHGARIEQWVMSCRVIGMKVEQAVLAELVAAMRAQGATRILAALLKTDVNQPCQTLFARGGFGFSGEDWQLDADQAPLRPAHVAIIG